MEEINVSTNILKEFENEIHTVPGYEQKVLPPHNLFQYVDHIVQNSLEPDSYYDSDGALKENAFEEVLEFLDPQDMVEYLYK